MHDEDRRLSKHYDELTGRDIHLVGKKNANLGEMLQAGFSISPGFALTTYANDLFMTATGIKDEVARYIKG